MYAAGDQSHAISGPVLLIVLIAGSTIYVFGYLRAVMHRANRDLKGTKATIKPLRRAFWGAWYAALRVGALVVVGVSLLIVWFVHDTRRVESEPPSPPPSVSVSVSGSAPTHKAAR